MIFLPVFISFFYSSNSYIITDIATNKKSKIKPNNKIPITKSLTSGFKYNKKVRSLMNFIIKIKNEN